MRRNRSHFLSVMLGLAFWASAGLLRCPTLSADDPGVRIVRTSEAKLHAQPVKIAPVLEMLKPGAELLVLYRKGEWIAVSLPDQRLGWVHQSIFTAEKSTAEAAAVTPEASSPGVPGRTATLKAASGRVRKAPSLNAPLAFGLNRGSRFTVLAKQGDWYHIQAESGQTGWLYHTLAAFTSPPPPAEAEAPPVDEEPDGAAEGTPSQAETAATESGAGEPGTPAPAPDTPPSQPESDAADTGTAAANPAASKGASGEGNGPAVILKARSGRVRTGPSKSSPTVFGIPRGTRAVVTETEGAWYRILLSDGRTGWASKTMFDIVDDKEFRKDEATPKDAPVAARPEESKTLKRKSGEKPAAAEQPKTETASAPAEAPSEKEIRAIRFETTPEGNENIIFELNGFHPPKTYTLDDQSVPMVVCEFADTRLSPGIGSAIPANGILVTGISIRGSGGAGSPVLVEAALDPRFKYSVDQVFFKKTNLYVMTFKK
ncbi:SH3 domain-containing protein [Desulfococcus sp.]|uniref:SH3 domain-containing protein n=1 Tax=Desulfococcus sp. TaxID=2025834 RepID=UPI003593B8F1